MMVSLISCIFCVISLSLLKEPAMCPIDSWAKGALPVMKPVPVPIAVESTAEVVAEQAAEHQESKNTYAF